MLETAALESAATVPLISVPLHRKRKSDCPAAARPDKATTSVSGVQFSPACEDFVKYSRGLLVGQAGNIGPISREAVRGLEQRGIHLNGNNRFPLQVTEQDLGRANLIIALKEAEHRRMLAEQFPAWVERVEYWHIHDLDCAEPADAQAQLEREVEALSLRFGA